MALPTSGPLGELPGVSSLKVSNRYSACKNEGAKQRRVIVKKIRLLDKNPMCADNIFFILLFPTIRSDFTKQTQEMTVSLVLAS
jgi:hypothetical protein